MGRCPSPGHVIIEYSRGGQRRRLHCSPLRLGLAAGLLGLMATGIIGGGCLIFRDELRASFAARETQAQSAYENRIAALRRRIDELAGGQVVSQSSVESRVQSLFQKQAQLETRAAAVAHLVERALASRVTTIARAARAEPKLAAQEAIATPPPVPTAFDEGLELRLGRAAKPTPLPPSDAATTPPPGRRERSAALTPAAPDGPLTQRLQNVAASIDRVAQDQRQWLSGVLRPALEEAARLRRVFDVAGISVNGAPSQTRHGRASSVGVGGPFVAAPETNDANGRFDRDLTEAQSAIATLEGLRRALPATPVRAPLAGPLQPTSSFGYRTDPFLGRPALHSGIDLRDSYGAPVRAAAGGVVSVAATRGGYGNVVEVDHGDGVSTRYGHLSEIDVVPGEPVKPGAIIGRVGSSGRSTGPHLHYEVRIDGEAVDPARFLEAAALLESTK